MSLTPVAASMPRDLFTMGARAAAPAPADHTAPSAPTPAGTAIAPHAHPSASGFVPGAIAGALLGAFAFGVGSGEPLLAAPGMLIGAMVFGVIGNMLHPGHG